jgi:hypothetical protein
MLDVRSADDVYPALEELMPLLQRAGEDRLATVLHHRLHLAVWTARGELFEELRDVIRSAIEAPSGAMPSDLRHQLERLVFVMEQSDGPLSGPFKGTPTASSGPTILRRKKGP